MDIAFQQALCDLGLCLKDLDQDYPYKYARKSFNSGDSFSTIIDGEKNAFGCDPEG